MMLLFIRMYTKLREVTISSQNSIRKHSTPIVSVVNDKPVCSFPFVSGKNNKIRKEYLGTGN